MEIVEVKTYSEKLRKDLNALLPQLSPSAQVLTGSALRRIIAADTVHLLTAVADGRYCGTLTLVAMPTLTGLRTRIEDVVVAETMRGRGIGRRLIEQALILARGLGARGIELTSHPSREAANALYGAMGFRQRETNVYSYRFEPE